MGEEEITVSMPGTAVKMTAILNRGAEDSRFGIIISHGAGGDSRSGHLPQITEAFRGAGFWCMRFDYKPPNLKNRVARFEALLNHAKEQQATGEYPVKRWIMAGHSMGGRVASAVAHQNPYDALGCIFFSYPLHPPNKTDQLREDPLTSLTAPILFVRGTNDNFCKTKEFESVKARMTSSDVQVHTVETGDHSLKARGGKQAAAAAVDAAIQAAVAFAQTLADADDDQQAEGPSVQEAKKRKDVGEKTDETDTVTHTRKRQRKTRPGTRT